jgi:hypothetical protein
MDKEQATAANRLELEGKKGVWNLPRYKIPGFPTCRVQDTFFAFSLNGLQEAGAR